MIVRTRAAALSAFLLLSLLALVQSKCPNWCSQHGICAQDGDTCECEMGYAGADCGTRLCPKGDDPLTKDQASRTIQLATGATRGTLSGEFIFSFNGESVTFGAAARSIDGAACAAIVSALPNVEAASCERVSTNEWGGGIYKIAFDSWPTVPWENNLFANNGNPPLSAFACNMTSISTEAWAPWCELTDVAVAGPIKEYAECSNRGVCDRAAGVCRCSPGFKGLACDDMTDADDVAVHIADGPFFTASVLKLRASREPSGEFTLLQAVAGETTALSLSGAGNLTLSGAVAAPAAVIGSPLLRPDSEQSAALARATVAVTVGSALYSGAAVAVAIESPAPGAALLQLTAGRQGEGLRVGADGSGSVFSGDGGVTVQSGDLRVPAGGLQLGGNVTAAGGVQAVGLISGAALSATGQGLSATLTAASGAAASVSAEHPEFTGQVLALSLANSSSSSSSSNSSAAALLTASSDGVQRFSIAGDGSTAVHYGGLAVHRGGLSVAAGGVHVESGGLQVKGGLSVLSGSLTLSTPQGLDVAGGGLRAATSEPVAPAVIASATAAGYAGTVLKIEATQAPLTGGASPFKLVEAVVAGSAVLNVTAAGDLQTLGSVTAAGDVTASGLLTAQGGALFARSTVSAGSVIDASAAATAGAFLSIADDGVAAENELLLPAEGVSAGRLLLVHNGDAQATRGAAAVPPGYTVLFVHDGARWKDLRVIDAAVTRLANVTSFTAAADLNIGEVAFKAKALVAGGAPAGHVAVYGTGGLLTAAAGLTWDAASGVVTVPKLKIGEMAGGVDFRGLPAKNMALTNVTIDELPFLKAHRILLASAATAAAPAAGTSAVRFAGLDAKGELTPLDAPFTLLDGLVPHARKLSVDALHARRVTGDVSFEGHAVVGARLHAVAALTGLQELTVADKLSVSALNSSTGALLHVGEGGALTAASGITLSDGVLAVAAKLRLDGGVQGGVDLAGGALSNAVLQGASVEGTLTGGTFRPDALETGRAVLGATVMTGALDLAGMPLLNVRPEDLRSAGFDASTLRELQELTVKGELRLGGRGDAVRGRLLVVGQDGAIVPAQADRLAVECDTVTAGRVTASSVTATGGLTAATVAADTAAVSGHLRAGQLTTAALQLDGDADGGGHRISNVALDRVSSLTGLRALTLEGDLTLSDLSGASREGALLTVGPGGTGRVTLATSGGTPSLRWADDQLNVPRISGHHVSGDVDMEGHVLKGATVDLTGGGSLRGLQDLRVAGSLHTEGDAFVQGSLTVGGSVMGGGPYMDSSDARLKTRVQPLDSALALKAVTRLRGVTYDWDIEAHPDRGYPAERQMGLLAQEVEAVLPLLVGEGADGYSAVAYSRLTPVLIEAVKQLNAENSALAERLAAAEARLQRLEAAVFQSAAGDRIATDSKAS